jgi:BlaI family transcriptional regulator, penicillinase repressor
MPIAKPHKLGELQLRIMEVLWSRGEATVGAVYDEVSRTRELAYTTIATMLRKMEARGLVKHRLDGRAFVYRAAVEADAVTRNMSGHLLDRFFRGSLADLVSHLLETRDVDAAELARIEKLIAERKKKK